MKRISLLLAAMVAALVLASTVALAQTSPNEGKFRVTLTGFTVDHETWDNATQLDGKRDEVYIRYDTRLVNNEATTLLANNNRTKVMGDTYGFPARVQAGSAKVPFLPATGGLQTGDSFPTNEPWKQSGNFMMDRPPIMLFEGTLTEGKTGVAIIPTIWEWDGGTDMFNSWGQLVVDNGPKIAQAVANLINGPSLPGTPTYGDFIKTNLETGLPALFQLSSGILGEAKDRPIGLTQTEGGYNFNSKSMILTYETATLLTQTNFGPDPGVLAVDFQDPADIGSGQYTAYIKVERLDTPPTDPTAPQISITTPPQGATYTVGQTVAADYSCTDADSGVASCEGVQPVGELENSVADGANIDTSSPGTKYFTVRATDNAGNTHSVSHTYTVNAKTTETTAPKVISTVPTANATGVAPGANATATFSEAMDASTSDGDPSTINGTTVKLFRAGTTTPIGAVVSYDATAKKAILNPNANLRLGTKYNAVITTGAQDLAGNKLDQNSSLSGLQQKTWSFTVRN
jgi:Bacterial Ig-like domain